MYSQHSSQSPILGEAMYNNEPDSPDELGFMKGDILTVLQIDTRGYKGWWLCSLYGRQGIAPGNRLRLIKTDRRGNGMVNSQSFGCAGNLNSLACQQMPTSAYPDTNLPRTPALSNGHTPNSTLPRTSPSGPRPSLSEKGNKTTEEPRERQYGNLYSQTISGKVFIPEEPQPPRGLTRSKSGHATKVGQAPFLDGVKGLKNGQSPQNGSLHKKLVTFSVPGRSRFDDQPPTPEYEMPKSLEGRVGNVPKMVEGSADDVIYETPDSSYFEPLTATVLRRCRPSGASGSSQESGEGKAPQIEGGGSPMGSILKNRPIKPSMESVYDNAVGPAASSGYRAVVDPVSGGFLGQRNPGVFQGNGFEPQNGFSGANSVGSKLAGNILGHKKPQMNDPGRSGGQNGLEMDGQTIPTDQNGPENRVVGSNPCRNDFNFLVANQGIFGGQINMEASIDLSGQNVGKSSLPYNMGQMGPRLSQNEDTRHNITLNGGLETYTNVPGTRLLNNHLSNQTSISSGAIDNKNNTILNQNGRINGQKSTINGQTASLNGENHSNVGLNGAPNAIRQALGFTNGQNPAILNKNPDILNKNPDILNKNPAILNRHPEVLNRNFDFNGQNPDPASRLGLQNGGIFASEYDNFSGLMKSLKACQLNPEVNRSNFATDSGINPVTFRSSPKGSEGQRSSGSSELLDSGRQSMDESGLERIRETCPSSARVFRLSLKSKDGRIVEFYAGSLSRVCGEVGRCLEGVREEGNSLSQRIDRGRNVLLECHRLIFVGDSLVRNLEGKELIGSIEFCLQVLIRALKDFVSVVVSTIEPRGGDYDKDREILLKACDFVASGVGDFEEFICRRIHLTDE